MDFYELLNIPEACKVGNTIFKKLFYENGELSQKDESLFIDGISKVTWIYCLKPETTNILSFKDEVRDYPEIEVIEVRLEKDIATKRIAEIIMRTIPYPMLLFFRYEERVQLYVAHQRISLNDSTKNTLEELISSGWLAENSSLHKMLNIKNMRFKNFLALYTDIVDAISVFNISTRLKSLQELTGMEARELSARLESIESNIGLIRAKLKKETQFNRKMEFNIEIKRLEHEMNQLIGGKQND
jgi:hypothetical protein